jgi:hypothetical protein
METEDREPKGKHDLGAEIPIPNIQPAVTCLVRRFASNSNLIGVSSTLKLQAERYPEM